MYIYIYTHYAVFFFFLIRHYTVYIYTQKLSNLYFISDRSAIYLYIFFLLKNTYRQWMMFKTASELLIGSCSLTTFTSNQISAWLVRQVFWFLDRNSFQTDRSQTNMYSLTYCRKTKNKIQIYQIPSDDGHQYILYDDFDTFRVLT